MLRRLLPAAPHRRCFAANARSSIDLGVTGAEVRRIERSDMGKLGALVAKIGLAKSRAEPFLERGATLHAVERLPERSRQRRRFAVIVRQSELPRDAVSTGEDHRAKRHIGVRRSY